jgi:predicted  nucleic acid-binding Zn-ribbon protein
MDNEIANEIRALNETVRIISSEIRALNETINNIFELLKEQHEIQKKQDVLHDAMMSASIYNKQKEIEHFIKNPIKWKEP